MPFLNTWLTSVVVHDFHVRRPVIGPPEADSELVVDTNAVSTLSIASQRFQPIARRRSQELKGVRSIEHREFARRNGCDRRKPLRLAGLEKALRFRATEALDHAESL
jgi:hypothetical protein